MVSESRARERPARPSSHERSSLASDEVTGQLSEIDLGSPVRPSTSTSASVGRSGRAEFTTPSKWLRSTRIHHFQDPPQQLPQQPTLSQTGDLRSSDPPESFYVLDFDLIVSSLDSLAP